MSRLSRVTLKGRDSIFAGGASDAYRGDIQATCPPSLEECVLLMEDCCEEAEAAQTFIYSASKDLPRMNKTLQIERAYLLTTEDTVYRNKAALIDEIEPAINNLIDEAEQGLRAMQKKNAMLRTKVDVAQQKTTRPTAPGAPAAQKQEAHRLQQLTKQREALESEIRALEAELDSDEDS
ncbi:hypothetical protein MKEN_00672400 [Mycena kentingensis (nom. inval.)]|nr:hypothetical protein MKEN_00672400 [Mycena kentingensis (nom. inval.)]